MAEILAKKSSGLRATSVEERQQHQAKHKNPLIAAIEKGKTLRKVQTVEKRPSRPSVAGGFSAELVQKMLERRDQVAESSDEEDSDDEEGAWD